MEKQTEVDTETIDLSWGECLKILSAIKARQYKNTKDQKASQRKGKLPPEGGADLYEVRREQYEELANRIKALVKALRERHEKGETGEIH